MPKSVVCSVVVPLYNEEEVVMESYSRLKNVMDEINDTYEIVFVNDGSNDKTSFIVNEICQKDKNIKFIELSRNFGHQIAITAGMDYTIGECIVVIDGDLQDPPELIPKMIEKWKEGYDVVFGKRIDRKGESFFKKLTATIFYRFLKAMTDVDIPLDTGDFRLIDRKVCNALKRVNEKNRYVRGIISWLGFKQIGLEFVRDKRFAGTTKYPIKKMVKFAMDAITSFSYKPLKLTSYLGAGLSFLSVLYIIIKIIKYNFFEIPLKGWEIILGVSLFFNGIVLMILGILGAYIGRIYDEAKNRPLYLIKNMQNIDLENMEIR